MAKYEVILKQHSPMIHFQADQYRATIRGSEFKPKLDKFLIKYFENKNIDYKEYVLRESTDKDLRCALDYKVKLYIDNDCTRTVINKFPNFFADTGAENEGKYEYINCEQVYLEIFSFNKSLVDCISKIIPEFLQNENFGMRQSKGFGSFYINDEKEYRIDGKVKKYKEDEVKFNDDWYSFDLDESDDRKIFENIELFYKTLRSGINLYGRSGHLFYFKSLVASYIQENFKNIVWDKKAIKNHFKKNSEEKYERIVKDVFGLSTKEKWQSEGYTITKKYEKDNKFDRFKSPLLFKPIRAKNSTKVYFKFQEIDSYFFDKKFNISNGRKNFQIKTISEFDFNNFFNWVLDLDLNNHIDKYDRDKAERDSLFKENINAKNIIKIYESIKENRYEVKAND
jgi:hypothetical protein